MTEQPSGDTFEFSADELMAIDLPPMASARMHRLPPYLFGRINSLKYQLRQQGVDIIDLGMGNPNDATPAPVVAKLAEAAALKRNQRYSVSQGVYNLRQHMADFYQRHFDVHLDAATEIIAKYDMPLYDLTMALPGGFDAGMYGALELVGICQRWRRKPYHTLTDEELAPLADFFKDVGVL